MARVNSEWKTKIKSLRFLRAHNRGFYVMKSEIFIAVYVVFIIPTLVMQLPLRITFAFIDRFSTPEAD